MRKTATVLAFVFLTLIVLLEAAPHARAQAGPFPVMAPLDRYLISNKNAEIALARSVAPASISDDATVMVLGRQG